MYFVVTVDQSRSQMLLKITEGGGGGEKVDSFLWWHSSGGKEGESYVNQAVARNDVNQNFVFMGN